MMTTKPRLSAAVAIVTTAIAVTMVLHSVEAPAQTVQTSQVMRQKLAESQQILAAVVTSNWTALDRHTRALEALTNQPGWDVMHLPEYHDQTVGFQRALAQLSAAVGQRDQRTAVTAYNALVTSCVECHRYVARARIATAK
jgi:hypothetical protein